MVTRSQWDFFNGIHALFNGINGVQSELSAARTQSVHKRPSYSYVQKNRNGDLRHGDRLEEPQLKLKDARWVWGGVDGMGWDGVGVGLGTGS